MIALIVSFGFAVIVSALCSVSEAALYSVPIGHIEVLAQRGRLSGRLLKKLRLEMDKPIAAILILNTVANTAGAAVAGAAARSVFGSAGLGIFSAVFTFTILTFSEIIPKTVGVAHAKRIAPLVAPPLQVLIWILMPLIHFYNVFTKLLTRNQGSASMSADEIRMVARMSRRSGHIAGDQELVIRNILELGKRRAWDIMTPRTVVFSLDANLTLEEANRQADSWPYSRVPVYDKNPEDVVGVVLRRDVLAKLAEDKKEFRLMDIMKPVHFIPHSVRADILFKKFIERRQHLFVVIDEYGQIDGIVTLEDVLEEIVGQEIIDEFDKDDDMQMLARRQREQVIARMKQEDYYQLPRRGI
ncbi:HlyC/CorC family transporter [bacterium]|nr:HlyC/CorC family transporter [candidate division CSSED10-310 bacterium]